MRYFLLCFFSLLFVQLNAQTRIDATLSFQTDPEKQYSIYVPSSYNENTPNKMVLGLHPLNTSRWNSISWCDTLIAFAEANDILMICPDGGADGAVDDPIDIAFTDVILDSMQTWYNVDASKIYAMGFSWGARTTYTYGLANVEKFAGFMPIGAAINGLNETGSLVENAVDKPFYIIHGSNDSPNSRFIPIRDALIDGGACVETNLLSGVGHTIDFNNRNAILTTGFQWLESVECGIIDGVNDLALAAATTIFPNPVSLGNVVKIEMENEEVPSEIQLFDVTGRVVLNLVNTNQVATYKLEKGVYFMTVTTQAGMFSKKLVIN
jgi:predicted esterase